MKQIGDRLLSNKKTALSRLNTLEKSIEVPCQKLQDATSSKAILDLSSAVQPHGKALWRQVSIIFSCSEQIIVKLNSLVKVCGEVEPPLQVIERERGIAQIRETALRDRALSVVHDHITVFRTKLTSQLSYDIGSWQELAILLAEEASAAEESGSTQPGPVTQDLYATLAPHNFTWNDWENLHAVADASNTHWLVAPDATIEAIKADRLTIPLATVASVKKMVQYVHASMRPRKKDAAV